MQNWIGSGRPRLGPPTLAQEQEVQAALDTLRRRVTLRNMDYFVAVELFAKGLSSSFVRRQLGVPLTTVRTWRQGRFPLGVREGFVDRALVARKMDSLWTQLLEELTLRDLPYHLALRLAAESERGGRRVVGSKVIARILQRFLGMSRLPEGTVGSWIRSASSERIWPRDGPANARNAGS